MISSQACRAHHNLLIENFTHLILLSFCHVAIGCTPYFHSGTHPPSLASRNTATINNLQVSPAGINISPQIISTWLVRYYYSNLEHWWVHHMCLLCWTCQVLIIFWTYSCTHKVDNIQDWSIQDWSIQDWSRARPFHPPPLFGKPETIWATMRMISS